jgi:hypothetical protein
VVDVSEGAHASSDPIMSSCASSMQLLAFVVAPQVNRTSTRTNASGARMWAYCMETLPGGHLTTRKFSIPSRSRTLLHQAALPTIYGDVEVRAADHTLIRQHGMAQVVKGPGGKTMFAMRSVVPGSELFGPPSAECKITSK